MAIFKRKKKTTTTGSGVVLGVGGLSSQAPGVSAITPQGTSSTTTTQTQSQSSSNKKTYGSKSKAKAALIPQPQSTLLTPTEAAEVQEVSLQQSRAAVQRKPTPQEVFRTKPEARTPLEREYLKREEQALIDEGREYQRKYESRPKQFLSNQRQYSGKPVQYTQSRMTPYQQDIPEERGAYILNNSALEFPDMSYDAESMIPKAEQGLVLDVQPVTQETGLKGVFQGLETRRTKLETSRLRGDKIGIFGGASLTGLTVTTTIEKNIGGLWNLGKGLFTKPIQTVSAIPAGIKLTVKEFKNTLNLSPPEVVIGRITGEVLFFKGVSASGKLVTKGSDIIRTAGLKEVPKEIIIAPEYFKGQNFPAIQKGQTAGQLLQEFKSKDYFTGLTASPKSFKSSTVAQAGSSELPGIYQAPKLSPNFLKITGDSESKVFSLNPFETFKPTALKITPTSYELIEGISPTQRTLTPLPKAKAFYNEKAELGKSYVPFIKTEKEAIIPAGTPLTKTGTSYYFKFEGRRIPIYEYSTDISGVKMGKIITTEDVLRSSSYRKLGSRGKITPVELYSSSAVSYSSLTPKFSYKNYFPSFKSNLYFFKKIGSYSKISSVSRIFSTTSYTSYASSTSSYSSTLKGSSYTGISTGKIIPFIPSTPVRTNKYFSKGIGSKGLFSVFGRRFGKFKLIGYGKTEGQAIGIGKEFASKTLGATFKIPGAKTELLPGYKTKFSKKEGKVFIQLPKYRLSTGSEKKEIKMFKAIKRRKK